MKPFSVAIDKLSGFRVQPGVFWATCHVDYKDGGGAKSIEIDGIPNDKAAELKRFVYQQVDGYHKGVFGKALAAWWPGYRNQGTQHCWVGKILSRPMCTSGDTRPKYSRFTSKAG